MELAIATGVAGLSIQDRDETQTGLYDLSFAVARIKAAGAAIDRSGTGVTLVAYRRIAERPGRADPRHRQAAFQHVERVTEAVAGYAGGTTQNPTYEQVSSGTTGHAESVRVTFDPARVSYATLLPVFSTALDATQVNRQGRDVGTQYRSELFVNGPEQERVARAYITQLDGAHVFRAPIATRIDPMPTFYPAEAYHQDYLVRHPDQPYIALHDIPKVEALKALFPQLWRDVPATVGTLAPR